jgi:hypothetical protein
MKRISIDKLFLGILLVIFGGIVLHAPFSVATSVLWQQYAVLFKSWKEIAMGVAGVLLLVIVWRRHQLRQFSRDRLLQLLFIYIVLHVILLGVFWQGVQASLAGLLIDLRYIVYFGLVYCAVMLYPQARRVFIRVGVTGALIVLGFALLQVFVLPADILQYLGYSKQTIVPYLTVDLNPQYIRINSTLRGPNPLGAYAGIVLALLVAATVKGRVIINRRKLVTIGILGLGGLVALWASYSRSALVAVVVAILLVLVLTVGRKVSRRTWIISSVIVCALAGGLIMSRGSSFVSNVLLHNNPNGGSATKSDEGHAASVATGFDGLIHQPFGGGIGSTGSASLHGRTPLIIENHYLFVAHEVGWLGLLLFLVIYGLILLRLWRRRNDWLALGVFASGIGLGLIGLLLPVWADDTVSIVWWGLAAVALVKGDDDDERRTSK